MRPGSRAAALLAFVVCLAAATIVGCSTTRLQAQWQSPQFAGEIRGPVLVVGMTRDDTVRRLYEDEMAARFNARGIAATPSYTVVPERLQDASGERLLAEARRAGAAMLLSSAVIDTETMQRVEVRPDPLLGWPYMGWYGAYWPYTRIRQEVTTWRRAVVQTGLADVKSGNTIWSIRTSTDQPANAEREVRALAGIVFRELEARRLL